MFSLQFKVYDEKSRTYKTTKVPYGEFLLEKDKPMEERECYKRALGLSHGATME